MNTRSNKAVQTKKKIPVEYLELQFKKILPILAIHSLTRGLQSTHKRSFRDDTHTLTDRTHKHCDLQTELAQRADAVKIKE